MMIDAMPPPPAGYVCYQAQSPIELNGRLDDAAWRAAAWSAAFQDIEGDAKPKPRHRTRMKMLWDEKFLYIAAELEEPHVWATIRQRDAVIFNDNDFEIFIDPDGDNHLYYEFEMNALNTVWDLLLIKPYRDGGPPVDGWDIAGLRTAVFVDGTINDPSDVDRGWSVEIAFPWKALAECAPGKRGPRIGEQWRIDFSRVEWLHEIVDGGYRKVPNRPEDNWVWSPQGVIDMHRPWTWGYVQFAGSASEPVAFHPDPLHEVKMALHAVYLAQRGSLSAGGEAVRKPADLNLPDWVKDVLGESLEWKAAGGRFEASIVRAVPGAGRFLVTIREDARLTVRNLDAPDDSNSD